ncbi:MAG: dihydroorotate dehydrogenase electron transfer subunit [Faecalibacterium sp.]
MLAACNNAPVLAHVVMAEDIRLLQVKWDDENGARAPHAGQFYTLRAWGADEAPFLSRPISVHGWDAESKTLSFLYQIKGAGTEKLARLAVGDTLQVTGPMGNGYDVAALAKQYKKIAVVGGGIGTAPQHQLAQELAACGIVPDVFFGFHSLPYAMEPLAAIEALGGLVKISTDDGSAGHKGFVTALYNPADYDAVLVCGPHIMMEFVAKACAAAGTDCIVSLEGKMACGIGACLGCTCKTTAGEARSICKHGPIFNASEVF